MSPKVSIIIPAYNAVESLERCVESIVLGEYRDVEVILIEDCSKDDSWQLCQDLSERFANVLCYQNKKNSGVSYTRNQGLRQVNGEYIMFVDSDDWVSCKYVKTMLEVADNNQDSLIICGLHYLDNVAGYRRKYLWNEEDECVTSINQEHFFTLVEKFLLQQLWNKIFRRDIISKFKIQFDESQSMGEDFQFVLDYMQAAHIKECTIINKPLYYYIRANNFSLMSKFGLIENENEFERLRKLKTICGADNLIVEQQYQKAVRNTQDNYIYQICRNESINNTEKIAFIEKLVKDGNAKFYIRKQKIIIAKEKMVQTLNKWKIFKARVEGRIRRDRRDNIAKKACRQLKVNNFTIISQNCIGGVFYHDMHMQFLSPTIGLFFKEPDFVKFVENLEHYVNLDIHMYWFEEYPVGKLDDISVCFMHYQSCKQAKQAWDRRKKRINWEKIIVLATDTEGFDDRIWERWNKIDYPKVLFTVMERSSSEVVSFPEYKERGNVPNLIPDREFYKDGTLLKIINACTWNTGELKRRSIK